MKKISHGNPGRNRKSTVTRIFKKKIFKILTSNYITELEDSKKSAWVVKCYADTGTDIKKFETKRHEKYSKALLIEGILATSKTKIKTLGKKIFLPPQVQTFNSSDY